MKEKTLIGIYKTEQEYMQEISDFLKKCNYASHYTRGWFEDGFTVLDVGSHSQFYYIREI